MAFPQTANLTNGETTSQTGSVLMGVPWSEGEMANIATLRAGYRVRIGGTTYPTHWHARGMPYPDGSLRMTYAVFRPTMAGGSASPTGPQFVPEVVAASNTGTSAASFAAWASSLNITVSYTDWLASWPVSENIAALARAGLNANTDTLEKNAGQNYYRIQDEGGVRTITYSAWTGLGRRHEPIRSLGHNNSGDTSNPPNPPVERDGLLHWLVTIQIRDQDSHATVGIVLLNDAAYTYPAAPPDGGARRPGQPDRPTHLDPNDFTNPYVLADWQGPTLIPPNSEQLEATLQRHIQNLTVTISHGSTTVHSRPWYVNDHATGAGPYGTITTSGNTTSIPIGGLADRQGWGLRWTVSATSEADAVAKARRPFTFLATPTYETWLNTEWTRTFVGGIADGDTCTWHGWWLFPLPTGIPASQFTRWWSRNNTPSSVAFMATTRSSPWHITTTGYDDDITSWERGGKHYVAGNLHEGEAVLAGCPEFLYKVSGNSLRTACKRIHLEHAALNSMDLIRQTSGGDRRTCYMEGTHIGVSGRAYTYITFGRHQRGADSGSNPGSFFNNAECPKDNPQVATTSNDDGPDWETHRSGTHIGARTLYLYDLLADDKLTRHMLTTLGHYVPLMLPGRGPFFGSSPSSHSARGELRPVLMGCMAALRSDDSAYRSRILGHMSYRGAAWRDNAAVSRWVNNGTAQNHDRNQYRGAACGVPPYPSDNAPELMQWWLIGQCSGHAMVLAMLSPNATEAASIAASVAVMTKATVDYGWWIDPARMPVSTAQRTFDTCYTSQAARPGVNPFVLTHGITSPKHSVPNRTTGTVTSIAVENLHQDVDIGNSAQTSQQWPALGLSLVFAVNRNTPGHVERVDYIKSAMRAYYSQFTSGEDYTDTPEQHLGFYTGESYEATPTGQPPSPTFAVSTRAGIIPLEVTLDPAASVINGDTSLATYRWWDNYTAGATPSATGTGVPAIRIVSYNGPGIYRPALEITQADGQARLYVDGPGIDARSPMVQAPIPRFTATPSTVLTGGTVQFSYVELGGRALTRVWQYKISTEPSVWTTFGAGATDPIWTAPVTTGTYDFRVTASNETAPGGVTHTELALIRVNAPIPPPTAYFDPSVTIGQAPLAVSFDASGSRFTGLASAVQWEWWAHYDPGVAADSDVTGTAGSSFDWTYTEPGVYNPGLRVTQADVQSHVYVYVPGIVVQSIPSTRPPIPDFTASATSVTAGGSVTLTYIEDPTGGRALSWAWSYKEQDSPTWISFSTERSPQWTAPATPGIYDFRVIATNEATETGTKERLALVTVTAVQAAPVPTFTPSPSYGGLATEVDFDAAASTYSGAASATTWEWFQDVNDEAPTATFDGIGGNSWSRIYSTAGTYYPALRLTQEDGQFALYVYSPGIVISVTPISSAPTPDFTVAETSLSSGDSVQVTYFERGVRATSYVWEYRIEDPGPGSWTAFGSGAMNPLFVAPVSDGVYSIRVTATNEHGSTVKTRTSIVTVDPPTPAPQAIFTIDETTGAAPLDVEFNASGSTVAGTLSATEWHWYANSSQGSPTQTITGTSGDSWSHTYSSAGTYYPMLIIEQSDGQLSTFIYTAGIVVDVVPVDNPPIARFRGVPIQVDAGDDVVFTYVEAGGRALTYSWEWRLGDGAWTEFATTKNASWEAPDVQGVYDIRVTATNEHGSSTRTRIRYITVRSAAPTATFTPDETSGQYPLEVVFDASGSTIHGDPDLATWDWYATSSDSDPTETIEGPTGDEWTHEYELPGVYTPMLVLTQEDGQESRYIYAQGIIVTTDPGNDPPQGTITLSDTTVQPGEYVATTWVDAGVLATSYVWEYSDDGSTWIEFGRTNPASWQAPSEAGTYSIRCAATNQNGTTTVVADEEITVSAGTAPTAAFTLSKYHFLPTDPLYPQPFCVATDGSTGADSWVWRVDPGNLVAYGAGPHTFQLPGKGRHRVTLTVFNAYGSSSVTKYAMVATSNQRVVVRDPKGIRNRSESEGV